LAGNESISPLPNECEAIFGLLSLGVCTHRDSIVYDYRREALAHRVLKFTDEYNAEVDRYRRSGAKEEIDEFVRYDKVIWSESLKLNLRRGRYAIYDADRIRRCLYRPFTSRWLYFDEILNERRYQQHRVYPTPQTETANRAIVVSQIGYRSPTLNVLVADRIPDLHVCAAVDGHQCFPFYVYDEDGGNRQENVTNWALRRFREHYRNKRISKWDIFYYVYGVLHHPGYRERFAENLKRALPRIPLAPDFRAFAAAGQKLARLHLDYEKLDPWPLEWIETPSVPLSYRVDDKMRLSKDRTALKVNGSLTLAHIPPEVFRYRLGNRSALDWVIDQYHVSEDKRSGIVSDPNRPDDPEYIVRLIGQVVRVSIETVTIVGALPADFGAGRQGLSDSKMRADVSDESEEG
jgi:predicted helicase